MFDMSLSVLLNQNLNWFYLINGSIHNSVLDFLMVFITYLGGLYGWTLICILIFVFGGKFGRRVALLGLFALFLSDILVISLKYVIAEPRPFLALPNVDLLTPASDSSFPSGHTASSFATALVIGLKYYRRPEGNNSWLIYPLLIFAVMVGISRVYVGVHYPYDVIFGALLGIICALLVFKYGDNILDSRIAHFFGAKKILEFDLIEKIKST